MVYAECKTLVAFGSITVGLLAQLVEHQKHYFPYVAQGMLEDLIERLQEHV